jgi:hypothetical protein
MKGEERADLETIKVLKAMIKMLEDKDMVELYERGFTIQDK